MPTQRRKGKGSVKTKGNGNFERRSFSCSMLKAISFIFRKIQELEKELEQVELEVSPFLKL